MKLDAKLQQLPLTKSNPKTLDALFGKSNLQPMWVADMDFQIAQPIQTALINRISDSGFGYEYKPVSFFIAQKKWYQHRHGIELEKNSVLYSPSITTAMAIVLEKYTSEKDGVITQPPVFMEFRDVIRNAKRRIVKNPLKLVDDHYEIDFEDLAQKASNKNNKVLIICNPHNPVGRVWDKSELQEIVRICKANDMLLISDEIHKDIILFDNTFTSVLQFVDDYENIIVCTSEAKTFNLCGVCDSMAIIPNEELRNNISATFEKYNLGRTNALTRVALETAYTHGEPWLIEVLQNIEQNIKTIETELTESKIGLIKPQGTYQAWLDFSNSFDDTKDMFAHMNENSGVALNAGHWFGREGALFMRMNIATSNQNVVRAIQNLKRAVMGL